MLGNKELNSRFGRHKASLEAPDNPARHQELRELWLGFTEILDNILDDGREKSVAFTELESASMWTHKALAKTYQNENEEGKDV